MEVGLTETAVPIEPIEREKPEADLEETWSNAFVIGRTLQLLKDKPEISGLALKSSLSDPVNPNFVFIRDYRFFDAFLNEISQRREDASSAINSASLATGTDIIPLLATDPEKAGLLLLQQFYPFYSASRLNGYCRAVKAPLAIELIFDNPLDRVDLMRATGGEAIARADAREYKGKRLYVLLVNGGADTENEESYDYYVKTHEEYHVVTDILDKAFERVNSDKEYFDTKWGLAAQEIATILTSETELACKGNDISSPDHLVAGCRFGEDIDVMTGEVSPEYQKEVRNRYETKKRVVALTAQLQDVFSLSSSGDQDLAEIPADFEDQRRFVGLALAQNNASQWETVFTKLINEAMLFRQAMTVWNKLGVEHFADGQVPSVASVFGAEDQKKGYYSLGHFANKGIAYMKQLGITVEEEIKKPPPLKMRKFEETRKAFGYFDWELSQRIKAEETDFKEWRESLKKELPAKIQQFREVARNYSLNKDRDEFLSSSERYVVLEDALYRIDVSGNTVGILKYHLDSHGGRILLDNYRLERDRFSWARYDFTHNNNGLDVAMVDMEGEILPDSKFNQLKKAQSEVDSFLSNALSGSLEVVKLSRRELKQKLEELMKPAMPNAA